MSRYLLDTNIISNVTRPEPSGRSDGAGQDGGPPAQRARHHHRRTAEVNSCIVVTDNERDFPGVQTFNPIRPGPR